MHGPDLELWAEPLSQLPGIVPRGQPEQVLSQSLDSVSDGTDGLSFFFFSRRCGVVLVSLLISVTRE